MKKEITITGRTNTKGMTHTETEVVTLETYSEAIIDSHSRDVDEETIGNLPELDTVKFTVPKEWFEDWCIKNGYIVNNWFGKDIFDFTQEVFNSAEKENVLTVISVENENCLKYMKAKYKVEKLVNEFGQAVLDVTSEELTGPQTQLVRDAILKYGDSGFLRVSTYAGVNVALECEKANEVVTDSDILLNTDKEKFYYFIKLDINFGEYGETSSYVFTSAYSNEMEAAEEFASDYYEETVEEDGKYSVNGDFYYSVGRIDSLTEEEYNTLNRFL